MRLELAEDLIEKRRLMDEWKKRKSWEAKGSNLWLIESSLPALVESVVDALAGCGTATAALDTPPGTG